MKYTQLAQLYEELDSTTKRLEKTNILSEFLKKLSIDDKDVMYLLLGRVYPEYDERKIGISDQLVIKSISKAVGVDKETIVKKWKEKGDLGLVAEDIIKKKKQVTFGSKTLIASKVVDNLRKLPVLEGAGTVDKKVGLIVELLTFANSIEAKYLARTLIGDLRIGVQESTIRDAMALAFFKDDDKKEIVDKIQKAIDRSNDIGEIFEIVKKGKEDELGKLHIQVGKPIKAMLAQKVISIEDGFKALGKPCAVEYKYDGFRLIIHKDEKGVKLYTRRLENVTKQFPEVIDYLDKYVNAKSFILDSEAVGFDKHTKEYQAFQHISQRIRRKHNIEELQNKLPIEVNVFDILYLDGKSLMDKSFKERTEVLRKIIKQTPYKIVLSKQIITSDAKKAEEFYKKALKDNQEGIMMKSLDASYQPGRRVGHMLKMKPEEKDLDLVITGAEYGNGKRSGWLSSFIISCRGNKKGEYLEVGKVSTGVKEKREEGLSYAELTEKLKPLIIKEKGKGVEIKPKLIVAVTYQEIQKSPNYKSGWALRFPRFTALRNDKPISEIASLNEIVEDFKNQKRNYQYG